jgi:hypothetical protein
VAQVLRYNMRFIHNRSANRILCTEVVSSALFITLLVSKLFCKKGEGGEGERDFLNEF